ncbi:MAG: GTP-binding protein, partial [Rhodothermales bacterium]
VLAGAAYPEGIPIVPESDLDRLIAGEKVDLAVFSYSDVSHEHVMHVASRSMAAGASFCLLGPRDTYLKAEVPVVAICASRTGAGKSPVSRRVASLLSELGQRTVIVRHPMPYGDLVASRVQRFSTIEDLDKHNVTIEEREEYEPHLQAGRIVYAGVDYEAILRQAEQEADRIIWDGGNNDLPFYEPDLHIVVVDPHRADHTEHYHPGETNVRMADVIAINKVETAGPQALDAALASVRRLNPSARVIQLACPIRVENGISIKGKRVLVIEDGPTLTHGGMQFGAGWVAARQNEAAEIVDPRPYAVGSIKKVFADYPGTGAILPAMGYGSQQRDDLAETIRQTPADLVLIATPIDLRHVIEIDKPTLRVRYDVKDVGTPGLGDVVREWVG